MTYPKVQKKHKCGVHLKYASSFEIGETTVGEHVTNSLEYLSRQVQKKFFEKNKNKSLLQTFCDK